MRVWRALADALDTGAAALVTVVASKGSAPREAGARMVVRADGTFTGTIGGGTLEWRVLAEAQAMLAEAASAPLFRIRPYALGPELGQCCGGHVRVAVELFGPGRRAEVAGFAAMEAEGRFAVVARPGPGGLARSPVADPGDGPALEPADDGALLERFGDDRRTLVLFGAGHVGRALVLALAPLPFRVIWVDPRPCAFPGAVPGNVTPVRPPDPAAVLADAPDGAFVLAVTHSHALDLEIVDAALAASRFPHVGVIGSATKRARFEKRLAELGRDCGAIARLVCPIGTGGPKSKLPAVIAAAVAVELIVADEALRAAPRRAGARPAVKAVGGGRTG